MRNLNPVADRARAARTRAIQSRADRSRRGRVRSRRGRARSGLAVAVAVLAVLTPLAGCGAGSGAPAPAANGVGPITFAIGSDDITWLKPVLAAWNRAHPGQKVTPLYLPQAANVQLDQLVANLQAKSAVYDVMDLDVVWTAEFASNGWVIPLPAKDFQLADFLAPAVRTARYQGRLYAVPDYSNADLLFYRKDILAKAHREPPATWSQLADLARTVAPRYHLSGYAGTFAQYEGLTVNVASAIASAGGSVLNQAGTKPTLNTPQALAGLSYLVQGFRQGWIPKQTLHYEEVSAQDAFAAGRYLFLDDWPDVWSVLRSRAGSRAASEFGVEQLPGASGPGSSSLGGANLAISAFSRHQQTALAFIRYLTSPAQQRIMLEKGSFPPVLKSLYTDPALTARYPYLHALYQAISAAQPRPAISDYDQASLVISSQAYQALTRQKTPRQALAAMQEQLTRILRNG